jgi:hypothetical protein
VDQETLAMYLAHLARLDFSLLHLTMGFRLQDFGAFEMSMLHIHEVLTLQVPNHSIQWG